MATNVSNEVTFYTELKDLLNKWSRDSYTLTPDFLLADYICDCLYAYQKTIKEREKWHGRAVPTDSPIVTGIAPTVK